MQNTVKRYTYKEYISLEKPDNYALVGVIDAEDLVLLCESINTKFDIEEFEIPGVFLVIKDNPKVIPVEE